MIEGVLVDLSGVLYVGDAAVPGAVDALARLRDAGLPVRFVTNVTRRPFDEILDSLRAMGFDIAPNELLTAPRAARAYIESRSLRPYLLIHPALEPEFADLDTESPDAVLLGDAESRFDYAHLNRAFRVLMEGGPLLAMGNNRYFQDRDGLSLDIGAFVAALEYASDREAVILGKPSGDFYRVAVDSLGCNAGHTVMVGDDALADVDGALAAGLQGILVRTGKYRAGDEDRISHPGARVVEDFPAAVERVLSP
ncbi:MAG: TIGR01458 family HAD-type hydrolase [Gammaproteobacteria bacterium]|nr:TIGR01458 family HAD-type hydrolase [Gammaproteobacteria bacterium]